MSEGKGKVALIAGVTGIVGLNLAKKMLENENKSDWTKIYGLSRRRQDFPPSAIQHVSCDLLDAESCTQALPSLTDVTHVFFTTWTKRDTEEANIEVNSLMLENLFKFLTAKLVHVVLVTGTKHYMGPNTGATTSRSKLDTPWREDQPRLPVLNFYYNQEDILFRLAEERSFNWTVTRPNLIFGFAPRSQMNLMTSIAVYASICKHLGVPFVFPGTKECLEILLSAGDADLIAEHILWQVNTPAAKNMAFNVVNGDHFRWGRLWEEIAAYFKVQAGEVPDEQISAVQRMAQFNDVWDDMVEKYGLQKNKLDEVATWWVLDKCMRRDVDSFPDMTRSRELGFLKYRSTPKCTMKLFDYLRSQKIIP